jgi:hypothetical protein
MMTKPGILDALEPLFLEGDYFPIRVGDRIDMTQDGIVHACVRVVDRRGVVVQRVGDDRAAEERQHAAALFLASRIARARARGKRPPSETLEQALCLFAGIRFPGDNFWQPELRTIQAGKDRGWLVELDTADGSERKVVTTPEGRAALDAVAAHENETKCTCAACQTGAGQCFSRMTQAERETALNLRGPVGKGRSRA